LQFIRPERWIREDKSEYISSWHVNGCGTSFSPEDSVLKTLTRAKEEIESREK
jgi:hypothetical protein